MLDTIQSEILKDEHGRVFFESQVIESEDLIYLNWHGNVSIDNLQKGVMAYFQMLRETGARKLLNDNRWFEGNFVALNDWITKNFIPLAIHNGLRYFAQVLSTEFNARFSAVDLGLRIKPVQFKAFKNITEAENWLQSK